jgi:ABC-type Co2+ transport system permease subunit
VPTWTAPGGGLISPGPQNTYIGYELAAAMTRLPDGKVSRVLAQSWAGWLNWHTTDAQLARALGVPVPTIPASVRAALAGPPPTPGSPLCTG